MEEKKQHEEFEKKYTLKAQEVEDAVARFSKEAKKHSDFTVNMEEVEKVVSAFKDVDSDIAITSMAIVSTVLMRDFKRMIGNND